MGVPTDVSGLQFWLKADALSLTNNDPVGSWTDSSVNGNHFTGSGDVRPLFKTNVINSKPAVYFDGTDDVLTLAANVQVRTVFIVSNEDRGSATFTNYYGLFTNTGGDPYVLGNNGGSTLYDGGTATWYWDKDDTKGASFDYALLSAIKMVCVQFASDYTNNWQIGKDRTQAGRFWKGNVVEVIGYSGVLSDADRQLVTAYLVSKYFTSSAATYDKSISDSFSVDDSITVMGLKSLSDSFSLDDAISVEGISTISDSFSLDDAISVLNAQKTLSESFSLHDVISAQKSGSKVLNLYQFNKGSESHFYAQLNNGIVKEATNQPPTVTTGDFGSEVFSGSASQIPASWAVVKDRCIMGNGVDGFQIYPGTLNQIKQVVVYKGSAAPGAIPSIGDDYTDRLKAGSVLVLDSLGDLAVDNDCVFVRTDLPADTLTWTVSAANGAAAVAAIRYFNGTWTNVSGLTDNTATAGATLAKSGTMTWTLPTDSQPLYMYGGTGYWYQVYLSSGDLDSEVEISALTYETDWQALVNMWDGVALDAVEAQFYDDSAGVHNTFGGSSIDIDEMTSSDILLFCSADPSVSFYFDFGDTPNTTASLTVTYKYFNGSDFASLSNVTDGTEGFTKSGWVTFSRPTDEQPRQYGSTFYAYWYTATVSGTLSDSVNVGITTTPYYDISEFGKGICCAAWKNRACYVFDRNPADITVTAIDEPLQLSSATNSDILYAGDGRQNAIKAMRGFYNELMVFQEEIGEEGGCITLFEGYDKDTHGKLVLSHKIGTMSNKTVDVIEGVQLAENRVGTVAVTLSHYGVFMIDGKSVADISEDIKNYFDGTKTECIRKGYENEMWLKWDSAQKLIRMGLVSGSSATVPNVFPVYDPRTREWYFDSLGQTITCMTEAKAGSGNVSVVQVGGGADGFVYQLNYGDDDVTTAIDSYVTVEFDGAGREMLLEEFILRVKAQAAAGAGNVTLTPYNNGVAGSAKTLSMAAILTGQASRRHRENFGGVKSDHFSIKIQNNAASMSMTLLDYAVSIKELTGQ